MGKQDTSGDENDFTELGIDLKLIRLFPANLKELTRANRL